MTNTNKTTAELTPPLPYSIKKLKQWEGLEGLGCHGEVHGPAGIVATFRDEGNGGGLWPEAPYDHKTQTRDRAAFEAFKEWANVHPILAITWKDWGFTPASNDHADQVIEWLLVESVIAKEVKKGYLCFQLEDPYESRGAKLGRKKVKYTPESAAWLKKQLPNCVIRNEETPSWCKEEVSK